MMPDSVRRRPSRGVKPGARAKDVTARQTEVAVEVLHHNVCRVGDADQDAVEAGLPERPDDAVEHLDGAVQHLQAGLARAAAAARGEDHEVRVGAVRVVSHADLEGVSQARGQILQVKRLCAGGLLVDVQEDDLVHQVLEHEAQGAVRAHAPPPMMTALRVLIFFSVMLSVMPNLRSSIAGGPPAGGAASQARKTDAPAVGTPVQW